MANYRTNRAAGYTVIDVPFASSVELDLSQAPLPLFDLGTLTGDINVTFINGQNGQDARVRVNADGHALNWDTGICGGSDDLALPAVSAGDKWDVFAVHVISAAVKPYKVIASNRGFET